MDTSKIHQMMQLLMEMELNERLLVLEQFITNRQIEASLDFGEFIQETHMQK